MKSPFEISVQNKLAGKSPEELEYHPDKARIWERINAKRSRKRGAVAFRPLITHTAAALAGMLLTGAVMFFVFRKNETAA